MKTTAIALFALTLSAFAGLQIPDVTTPHTAYQTNTYYATVTGFFTNQPLTVWRSTVTYGDPLPVAFGKLSTNDLYLQANAGGGGNPFGAPVMSTLLYTNGVLTGTNYWGSYTNFASFITTGTLATNLLSLDGTNYQNYFYTNPVVSYSVTNYATNYFGTNFVVIPSVQSVTKFSPVWLATAGGGATNTVTISGLTWQAQTAIADVFTNFSTPPVYSGGFTNGVAVKLTGTTNTGWVPVFPYP